MMIKSSDNGKYFEMYASESAPGPVKFQFVRVVRFCISSITG